MSTGSYRCAVDVEDKASTKINKVDIWPFRHHRLDGASVDTLHVMPEHGIGVVFSRADLRKLRRQIDQVLAKKPKRAPKAAP